MFFHVLNKKSFLIIVIVFNSITVKKWNLPIRTVSISGTSSDIETNWTYIVHPVLRWYPIWKLVFVSKIVLTIENLRQKNSTLLNYCKIINLWIHTVFISGKVLSRGTNKDQSKQKSELVHIELLVQKVLMERSTSVFNFYTVWINSYCQLLLLYYVHICQTRYIST